MALDNLRSWPGGVLVIGDCPACGASLASRRPVGWTENGHGDGNGNGHPPRVAKIRLEQ